MIQRDKRVKTDIRHKIFRYVSGKAELVGLTKMIAVERQIRKCGPYSEGRLAKIPSNDETVAFLRSYINREIHPLVAGVVIREEADVLESPNGLAERFQSYVDMAKKNYHGNYPTLVSEVGRAFEQICSPTSMSMGYQISKNSITREVRESYEGELGLEEAKATIRKYSVHENSLFMDEMLDCIKMSDKLYRDLFRMYIILHMDGYSMEELEGDDDMFGMVYYPWSNPDGYHYTQKTVIDGIMRMLTDGIYVDVRRFLSELGYDMSAYYGENVKQYLKELKPKEHLHDYLVYAFEELKDHALALVDGQIEENIRQMAKMSSDELQ